ncbi:hypothetical protein ASD32_00180 [Rhizobium sp. Root483D2]|nr:hypothetical protein ASD32_00180 [Rhizobium sp. Root483D2]
MRGRVGAKRRGGVTHGIYNDHWHSRCVTPTRDCAATSPLKGEVGDRPSAFRQAFDTLALRGRVGAKRRGGVIHGLYNDQWHSRCVTPTRDDVATSPLKGEVEFPLLPSGEKVARRAG